MARTSGRNLQIKDSGGTVIAVVNSKTINYNNSAVAVTGDSDSGYVTYLPVPGEKQIVFDASGFTDNTTLRGIAATATGLLASYTVEYLDTDGTTVTETIAGDFFMTGYSETGGSEGALEFSATFSSSGAYVRTVI